jgi:hypothetical protein
VAAVTASVGEGTGAAVVTGPVPADWVQPAKRIPKTTITMMGIAYFFIDTSICRQEIFKIILNYLSPVSVVRSDRKDL